MPESKEPKTISSEKERMEKEKKNTMQIPFWQELVWLLYERAIEKVAKSGDAFKELYLLQIRKGGNEGCRKQMVLLSILGRWKVRQCHIRGENY